MPETMAESYEHDNFVEYRLFPHTPEFVTPNEVERYLQEQIEIFYVHLSSSLVGFIWQNEPFLLRPSVPSNDDGGLLPHLVGRTYYGDNVEDEWFIVYLLRSLTEEFPGLVAQVSDNDGEFMLIEAANSLPKWVDPETAENRVYLYEGLLHVIPYPLSPAHIALLPTSTPSYTEAVTCIRGNPTLTMASVAVQQDIQNRLEGYPEKAKDSIHHAHCFIPAPLAAVLEHNPALLSPIIQAFYCRDPLDLKACVTFQHFPPGTRVMRRVPFTRCLYAQLLQQKFTPDRRSGYTLPAPSNSKYKAYDLGVKLVHGAEILCSKCGSVEPGLDPIKAVTFDPRWHRYLATLTAKGYFRNELEGSQLYRKLLDDAKRHFVTSIGTMNSPVSPGVQILQALKVVSYDVEEMRKEEKSLSAEDDDSWINITAEELDALMENASGVKRDQANGNDLEQMTQGVKDFINKVSSHEGAEIPGDDADVQLDPNSFMQSMQKVFEFEDSDISSSDMSEYGSDDELEEGSSKVKYPSPTRPSPTKPPPNDDDYLGIKDYMDIMDRELAKTNIGQSFEKDSQNSPAPKAPPRRKKQARMNDSQTSSSSSSSAQSTPLHKPSAPQLDSEDIDDLEDDFEPVNVDLNIVKNLMESYKSQAGLSGPASNMLGSMAIRLPQDDDF